VISSTHSCQWVVPVVYRHEVCCYQLPSPAVNSRHWLPQRQWLSWRRGRQGYYQRQSWTVQSLTQWR